MRHSLILQLNRLAFDRWTRRALRVVLRSAWLALCVWCAGVGLSLILGRAPDMALLGAVALGVLGVGLVTLLLERPLPPEAVARRLDWRFRLQEQLSTAVELSRGRVEPDSVGALLLDQSTQTLRTVRRRVAQRQRAPWSDVLALASLLLVAVGLLLFASVSRSAAYEPPAPLPPLAGAPSEPPPEDPQQFPQQQQGAPGEGQGGAGDQPGPGAQAGQPGAQAGGQGQQGQGQGQQAGQGGETQASQASDPDALRNLGAIADALRDQGVTRPAAEALDRGDPAAAARELRSLADQASQLSEDTRRQLADSLRRAASKIQGTNPNLAQQLRDSARGLERGDDRAAEGLDGLAQAIEQQAGQGQPGQQQGQQGQQGQASQPGQPSADPGDGSQPGSGNGAGNAGAGEQRPIENPQRLGVDGQPVQLDVAPGPGSPGDTPPQATAGEVGSVGSVSGGGGGGGSAGSGPDPLRVPADERDVVQDYFTH